MVSSYQHFFCYDLLYSPQERGMKSLPHPGHTDPYKNNPVFPVSRLLFPITNSLVFVMVFGLLGYYISDVLYWVLIGLITGLGIGLLFEWGFGKIGGWIYRLRVSLVVFIEVILSIMIIAPFVYMYIETIPNQHPVCCIENSQLGTDVEKVYIPVADGQTLIGWYAPPASKRDAVIIIAHGSGGDRNGSLAHARVLHDAGYGVLVYDQRASGESTGDRQSLGLDDARDISPIIDWLTSRPEVNNEHIGGVGLSLGAHILMRAGAEEPRLKAIWSDGLGANGVGDVPPAENINEMFMNFIENQTYWLGEIYLGERWILCKTLIPQIAPRHLMLVAGGLDYYEATFNRGYEPYLGKNGSLWVIENAGHVGGLYVNPDLYSARMIDFFDTALQ